MLEALGFEALATTSSGFAFTLGRPDGGATLDEVAEHVERSPRRRPSRYRSTSRTATAQGRDAARAIARAAAAGAVGGSIEDYEPGGGIYSVDEAAERIVAAAEDARRLAFPFTLTGRAENHIRGNPDLGDTIARLQAYEAAGADVLYAPGLANSQEISAICEAVSKPVNVLAHRGLTMSEIVAAGAQRVSVGGALTWVAVGAMAAAAQAIRDEGDFSVLSGSGPRVAEWLEG